MDREQITIKRGPRMGAIKRRLYNYSFPYYVGVMSVDRGREKGPLWLKLHPA